MLKRISMSSSALWEHVKIDGAFFSVRRQTIAKICIFVGFEKRKRSTFVRFCKIVVNFESAKNVLFRQIFRFFLQGTVEQAEILIILFFLNFLAKFFEVEILRQKSIFRILGQNFRSRLLRFSGIFLVWGLD